MAVDTDIRVRDLRRRNDESIILKSMKCSNLDWLEFDKFSIQLTDVLYEKKWSDEKTSFTYFVEHNDSRKIRMYQINEFIITHHV